MLHVLPNPVFSAQESLNVIQKEVVVGLGYERLRNSEKTICLHLGLAQD